MNCTAHSQTIRTTALALIAAIAVCLVLCRHAAQQAPPAGSSGTAAAYPTIQTACQQPYQTEPRERENPCSPSAPEQLPAQTEPGETEPGETETGPLPIRVAVLMGDRQEYMDLEQYILGVVLAEMPARFDPEALKAQAVAARTYTLKNCISGYRHDPGTVCTSSACCQAYRSPQTYLAGGGKPDSVEKVSNAVLETAGQVLTYGGKLIDAAYFSCSGGATEDAVAVWGYEVPYLRSVSSPETGSSSAFYREYRFSVAEFQKKLSVELQGPPENWFGEAEYTNGGGVAAIRIGGKIFNGAAVRSALKLRSTQFQLSAEDDAVLVCVWGLGHRVGMSQYGADALARAGMDYRQILAHYYSGAELAVYPFT